MDPLTKQLSAITGPLNRLGLGKLSPVQRYGLIGLAAVIVLGLVLASSLSGSDHYQYVFTNLTAEDSTEVAEHLKAATIPFRLEAGGAAVAVPEAKVYDARLLLASMGLPRGGGVGFELFDRGDIGVSEFTQHINLRRAVEGELARTIGHLSEVRSARVHLSFEEKTLFRDDAHKAAAAVVVNLQPGRTLDEREVAGIRHLVSSSVPGLEADAVTLVDGSGRTLSSDADGNGGKEPTDLEHGLEQRVVSLLETVVGKGAVVAKLSATMDDAEVTTNSEVYDPDSAALRSDHKSSQNQTQDSAAPAGVAGAAANQPVVGNAPAATVGARGQSASEDQQRNFELSKTTTHMVKRTPRLAKLSAAILVDGLAGKPRSAEEVARLGEIAKRAIGFDAARGDTLEISSQPFIHPVAEDVAAAEAAAAAASPFKLAPWKLYAGGGVLLALVALAAVFGLRRKHPGAGRPALVLEPGSRVSELEQRLTPAAELPAVVTPPALADPAVEMRNRALELAQKNPARAAHLLRAWIASDNDFAGAKHE